jgi:hypothetical protein
MKRTIGGFFLLLKYYISRLHKSVTCPLSVFFQFTLFLSHIPSFSPRISIMSMFWTVTLVFLEGGVGLAPKRGCLLTLAYYAFPRWYEFGERRWNDILTGKTEELGDKPVPVPLYPPQIPHGLTWARTRASAVRSRRLTTWAMARPLSHLLGHQLEPLYSRNLHQQNCTATVSVFTTASHQSVS